VHQGGWCKPVGKPDSVPTPGVGDGHPSGTPVARRLVRSDPGHGTSSPWAWAVRARPCSTLLRAGFAWPAGHPTAGGLLPHHFTVAATDAAAVSFLWHSPSGRPDWVLPAALLCGVQTFLRRRAARGRPTGLRPQCTRRRPPWPQRRSEAQGLGPRHRDLGEEVIPRLSGLTACAKAILSRGEGGHRHGRI
jgi:hypothetical protein